MHANSLKLHHIHFVAQFLELAKRDKHKPDPEKNRRRKRGFPPRAWSQVRECLVGRLELGVQPHTTVWEALSSMSLTHLLDLTATGFPLLPAQPLNACAEPRPGAGSEEVELRLSLSLGSCHSPHSRQIGSPTRTVETLHLKLSITWIKDG